MGDLEAARRDGAHAIEVAASERDRSDMDLAVMWRNQGRTLQALGEADAAQAALAWGSDLARRSAGERSGTYWSVRAEEARLLCLRGRPEAAEPMFDALLRAVPAGWKETTDDADAQVRYAECLLAQGRAAQALPLLERAVARYAQGAQTPDDMARARHALAAAWLASGRPEAARDALAPSASQPLSADDLEGRMLMAQAALAAGRAGPSADVARAALRAVAAAASSSPASLDVPWRARLALVDDAIVRHDPAGAEAALASAKVQRAAIRAVVDRRLDERQAALGAAVAALR
jgi:serine/threonine-protein kinase